MDALRAGCADPAMSLAAIAAAVSAKGPARTPEQCRGKARHMKLKVMSSRRARPPQSAGCVRRPGEPALQVVAALAERLAAAPPPAPRRDPPKPVFHRTCQWPVSGGRPWIFCGKDRCAEAAQPYCAEHQARAVRQPSEAEGEEELAA